MVFGYSLFDAFSQLKSRTERSHCSHVAVIANFLFLLQATSVPFCSSALASVLKLGWAQLQFLCCQVSAHGKPIYCGRPVVENCFIPVFFSVPVVWWRRLIFQNIVGCSRLSSMFCSLHQYLPTQPQETLKLLLCGCSESEITFCSNHPKELFGQCVTSSFSG